MSHNLQLTLVGKNNQLFTIGGGSDDAVWANFKDTIKSSLMSFSVRS
ncbi:MAG: hypothetical protein UU71_C0023G0005 [Parcubacteria group bacterium GW2011_GWB1_41_6]|nr:MAG: hypothetical protein UU01_C0003G0025 [Parcubacteria group bacterium GW2011_GWA2_40_37]KKS14538.1 MAG: hypothetical protein UU71_C0023G0005 [Parcubacteria group bacterium GW2011_GWB1_41_6]KKS71926.1 MAG: hypothetical protein UV43_C0025G0006 [Parcubacteria group bacterium GW2011_GWF2_42_7]